MEMEVQGKAEKQTLKNKEKKEGWKKGKEKKREGEKKWGKNDLKVVNKKNQRMNIFKIIIVSAYFVKFWITCHLEIEYII